MSTNPSAAGRAWTAFLLAAAMVVAGYASFMGPGAVSAQESVPAPTVVPRQDPSEGEAIAPAPDEGLIAPTPDESLPPDGLIAPAPDESPPDEGPITPTPDGIIVPATEGNEPQEVVIDPAPDGSSQEQDGTSEDISDDKSFADIVIPSANEGTGEESLIAPAPADQTGDDGIATWVYGLLAGFGAVALAGSGTLAWRLRRHRA